MLTVNERSILRREQSRGEYYRGRDKQASAIARGGTAVVFSAKRIATPPSPTFATTWRVRLASLAEIVTGSPGTIVTSAQGESFLEARDRLRGEQLPSMSDPAHRLRCVSRTNPRNTTMDLPDDLDLDLELHENFDRRWRVGETIVITILSLLCLAALAGAVGSGALSHATGYIDSAREQQIRDERIVRNHGSSWMRVSLAKGATGVVSVHLDRRLLDSVAIDSVSPMPIVVQAARDGVTYLFDVDRANGASLNFKMSPFRFGFVHSTLRVGGGRFALSQAVLP
jgi:hypothetical protein